MSEQLNQTLQELIAEVSSLRKVVEDLKPKHMSSVFLQDFFVKEGISRLWNLINGFVGVNLDGK